MSRSLRIAFLLPTFPELSNTFIVTQAIGLIERGHEVDLFAVQRKRFEGAPPEVARLDQQARMRHLVVPRGRWMRFRSALALLASPGGRHPAMLDALNPIAHGRQAWNLVHLHTAASFLRARRYDVLHCQFGDLGPAAERLVRLGAVDSALVTSFRGADLTAHLERRPRHFAALFRRGDLFMPVSAEFRRRLIAAGAPAERVAVHHSGIDVARFPFLSREAPVSRPVLLFVGRLTEKKGLEYVLHALASLRASGRDAELNVIGGGPLERSLALTSRALGLDDRVAFLGPRPYQEVVQAMHRAHVLVAPSVTAASGDQEGIPNVLKEAMATGMPVVATRHSGIPELVEHGVNGFLVPERDAESLALHLGELLDHPERWPAFGRAGRERVVSMFDARSLNDALVEHYREVVAARDRHGA